MSKSDEVMRELRAVVDELTAEIEGYKVDEIPEAEWLDDWLLDSQILAEYIGRLSNAIAEDILTNMKKNREH